MKKTNMHRITDVAPDSIAMELGLEPGDMVVSVNGHQIEDLFDYQYYIEEEYLEVEICTKDGQSCMLEIEKEEDEDLGLTFESSLMDQYHSCSNKCIFCFIDQMPPGMRETLYFKDDDSRLSFLQGNYITLTNMSDSDVERLIRYRLSPINISVHTTNPDLRCRMLNNRFAGNILKRIRQFYEARIEMNAQIVLCRGINDGEELSRTIRDLGEFLPWLKSLSVVPVGLTRFRDHLTPLKPFDAEEACKVLACIHGWQDHFRKTKGSFFVHASDEWYIMAGKPFPPEESYEGYGQLENGVGMMRLFLNEVEEALLELPEGTAFSPRTVTVATAVLAYPTIRRLAADLEERFPGLKIHVHCIRNEFFGERITVSGLLTGRDIIRQLEGKELGQTLFLPANVLRAGEDVLLDDVRLKDISQALQVDAAIIKSEGQDFVYKLAGINGGIYE